MDSGSTLVSLTGIHGFSAPVIPNLSKPDRTGPLENPGISPVTSGGRPDIPVIRSRKRIGEREGDGSGGGVGRVGRLPIRQAVPTKNTYRQDYKLIGRETVI